MAKVLPHVPSPLEQLTPYIAQAAGSISQAVQQRSVNKKDEQIIEKMFDENTTPTERIKLSLQLSPKRQEAFCSALRASGEGEKFGCQYEREKCLSHPDVLKACEKRISQVQNRHQRRWRRL